MYSFRLAFSNSSDSKLAEKEMVGLAETRGSRFKQWCALSLNERRDVMSLWLLIRDLVLSDCRHSSVALNNTMEAEVWSSPVSLTAVLHDHVLDLLQIARDPVLAGDVFQNQVPAERKITFEDLCVLGFYAFGIDVDALHQRDDLPQRTTPPKAIVVSKKNNKVNPRSSSSAAAVSEDENNELMMRFDMGDSDPGRLPVIWKNYIPGVVAHVRTGKTAKDLARLVRLGLDDIRYECVAIAAAKVMASEFAGPSTAMALNFVRASVPVRGAMYRQAMAYSLAPSTISAISGELTHFPVRRDR